jgi:hypothetical protein
LLPHETEAATAAATHNVRETLRMFNNPCGFLSAISSLTP